MLIFLTADDDGFVLGIPNTGARPYGHAPREFSTANLISQEIHNNNIVFMFYRIIQ